MAVQEQKSIFHREKPIIDVLLPLIGENFKDNGRYFEIYVEIAYQHEGSAAGQQT